MVIRNFKDSSLYDLFHLTRYLAFLTAGDSEAAIKSLQQITQPEKITNLHMLKAIGYYSAGDNSKAKEELKQTVPPYSELPQIPDFDLFMNDPAIGPRIGLALYCYDQKFYRQAIAILKETESKVGDNILLTFIQAECYLGTNQFSLGIEALRKINRTLKNSYAIQFYLCQAYARAGMLSEAEAMYEILTEERPDFIMANLTYGKLLSNHNKWEAAKKIYESGLNFNPDSIHLQIALGWTLAFLGETDELENLLQIVKKNEGFESVSFLHLKGWNHFKREDFTEAVNVLKKAIEISPGDPEIAFHLGMAMIKVGEVDSGRNLLNQSMLFPKQREKYQELVEKIP
ncbi:tetratricopeptide repeat protein [Desulforhopalus sp. IMCC35007]|uniref:tetratricopeptide repeat protein n=1 Tax=Desulforhopalus sp. IMCC35007 TaxID=2569543 RepID=UPI0010ADB5F8|nr:tetratricopeptide repeat protein [Desulforhopalus sp. IMCC35007]TKB05736.1 tetratricopeptide repeat protein [Desulforhopalus sp. IMCC35007]